MKFSLRILGVALVIIVTIACSSSLALEPVTLHWDLSEWWERTDSEGKVSISEKGLSIDVKKRNFCIPSWNKLPSKVRYLSDFSASAEIVELQGGRGGVGFATDKNDLLFLVSSTNVELRYAGSGHVIRIKEKKIKNLSLPATIRLDYDTTSGTLIGFINNEEVIRGNVDDKPEIPKISFLRYVVLWGCSDWDKQFAHVTFSTLDVEVK